MEAFFACCVAAFFLYHLFDALNVYTKSLKGKSIVFSPWLSMSPKLVFFPEEGYFVKSWFFCKSRRIPFSKVFSLESRMIRHVFQRSGAGTSKIYTWEVAAFTEKHRRLFRLSFHKVTEQCYELQFLARILGVSLIDGQERPQILLPISKRKECHSPMAKDRFLEACQPKITQSFTVSVDEKPQEVKIALDCTPHLSSAFWLGVLWLIIGLLAFFVTSIFTPAFFPEHEPIIKPLSFSLLVVALPLVVFFWEKGRFYHYSFEISPRRFFFKSQEPFSPEPIGEYIRICIAMGLLFLLLFCIFLACEASSRTLWILSLAFVLYLSVRLIHSIRETVNGKDGQFECALDEICGLYYEQPNLIFVSTLDYAKLNFPQECQKALIDYVSSTICQMGQRRPSSGEI